MKTIIVPTDFSANADKALKYASRMAAKLKLKLVLHHSFDPMFTSDDLAGGAYGYQHSEDAVKKELNERIGLIKDEVPELNVEYSIKTASLVEDLEELAKANEDPWLVIGTQGASGLKKALIGSSSIAVINNLRLPTLIIPESVKMEDPKKIAFASDFDEIEDENALDPLREIALDFDAEVHIVNVRSRNQVSSYDEALERNREGYILEDVKHKFVQMYEKDVEEGLSYYLNNVDEYQILAMVKRSHSLLDQILGTSHTSEMAFAAEIPLLVMHDQN